MVMLLSIAIAADDLTQTKKEHEVFSILGIVDREFSNEIHEGKIVSLLGRMENKREEFMKSLMRAYPKLMQVKSSNGERKLHLQPMSERSDTVGS